MRGDIKGSALHRCLEWNDSTAAKSYRIEQAKKLIEEAVTEHGAPKYVEAVSEADWPTLKIVETPFPA